MKAVVQRVCNAGVTVGDTCVGSIEQGLLVYLGIQDSDNESVCRKMAQKICSLRIFQDDNGKMNLSVRDTGGEVLVVSQFTLYADLGRGNRPSWNRAGNPVLAERLYRKFIAFVQESGIPAAHGEFGAHMVVSYSNIGPVTIIVDSDEIFRKSDRMEIETGV